MSFLSGIKAFGKDVAHVLGWAGSPTGQKVIGVVETGVEAIVPASAPVVNLFNEWAAKAYTVEAIGAAAAANAVTGADKSIAVTEAIEPTVLQYAQSEGLSPRTAAQIQAANDAAVAFIKAMTDEPAPIPAAPPVA
jgi:hypothetical protein